MKSRLTISLRLRRKNAFGKSRDKTSLIMLNDGKGKPRMKISVAVDGTPKLDFLDENGKVIYSLPEDAKAKK